MPGGRGLAEVDDLAGEVGVAAADVGDGEQLGDQMLCVVGGRRQPAGAGRAVAGRDAGGDEGGDGLVGGGELGTVGTGGVGGPGAPVAARRGDPVGLGRGAAKVVGAGVADVRVVAVVELPAAAVQRSCWAAGGRWVGVAGVGV